MDAIQFGRWLSERRRLHGWNSQRAFVDTALQHPLLSEQHISEDFLARLEAGLLVHPFRGSVRRRVLAMAVLLCKTSREVRLYLRAAEFTDLNDDEANFLNRLNGHLVAWRHPPTLLPLPPRPARLFGRESLVQELVNRLATLEKGLCALTGMPGIGKSALAYEVVHRLASNEGMQHVFPDGIATFTCTGRRGQSGLVALLNEIADAFSPSASTATTLKPASISSFPSEFSSASPDASDGVLAEAMNRVRLIMASKRLLLLLDDVDARFPLRQLVESLFAQDQNGMRGQEGSDGALAHRVVLTTSRYIPSPALLAAHFHLGPLEPEAALELLMTLIDCAFDSEDRVDAQQLCAAVGYLPLAIEVAATAVKMKGIPLAMLAARVARHPLDKLLDGEQELSSTLMQALEPLDPEMQRRFALLPTLGVQSFRLESATAISLPALDGLWLPGNNGTMGENEVSSGAAEKAADRSLTQLAHTAADLGQFVRHSLIELVAGREDSPLSTTDRYTQKYEVRYQVHPLLYAHALDRLSSLEPEVVSAAERNVQAYAQAYLEHYQGDVPHLDREREFLLAALTRAWQQEQYPLVVHFVLKLVHVIGCHSDFKEGERVLRWGICASQHLQDRYSLARFMNCLAIVFFNRGELLQAKKIWEECLEIAGALGYPVRLLIPFINLAIVADFHDEYDTAQRLADTYLQRVAGAADPVYVADAYLYRGKFARLSGDSDRAFEDQSAAVQLLSLHSPDAPCLYTSIILAMAQAELARVRKDYACAQEYTDVAVYLLQEEYNLNNVLEVLFEQARFARQEGLSEDARVLARRVVKLADQIGAPHMRLQGMNLLRQLLDAALA